MTLQDEDFPSLYVAADRTSLEGQRQYVMATTIRLWAAVLAAVAALSSGALILGQIQFFGLVAAAFFFLALGLEVWLLTDRPEKDWYDGRALAESVKTLAWRYAVGGAPFPVHDRSAARRLAEELANLLGDAPDITIVPRSTEVVTPKMAELRNQPEHVRRDAYIRGRIVDQQTWYAVKARHNVSRARQWKLILIALELVGVVMALVKAFGYLDVDIAGVTSAAIGGGAAWLGVRQHDSLARSYTFASHELALAAARLSDVKGEANWAMEVAGAEEAISREHTMWRASRLAFGAAMIRHRTDPGDYHT